MRKDEIAESILSLFTSPERAAAATGDLMEDSRERGTLWFWGAIAKTAASRLLHDLTDSPLFLTGLAFRGILYSLWFTLLWNVAAFALMVVFALVWNQVRGLVGPGPSWLSTESVVRVFFQAVGLTAVGMAQLRTGNWLARRGRSMEIAACVAYLLLGRVLWSVAGWCLAPAMEAFVRIPNPTAEYGNISIGFVVLSTAVGCTALYWGAIRRRRASLRESMRSTVG